jgi:hypothetical protein
MNPSQLIAWLICLLLAFFAAALSVSNSYKAALLDRKFVEVQKAATDQSALLSDVRRILEQIERDLRSAHASPTAGAAESRGGAASALPASPGAQPTGPAVPAQEQRPR